MTGLLQRPDPHRRAITVANVRFLWVIHTTADVDNADADVPFDLVYYGGIEANQKLGTFRFPDLPNPDEKSGRERTNTSSTLAA